MPPLGAWFSGTALFFAGSFAFGLTVGLTGIKQMMSKKIFALFEIIAIILTACAWWSAADSAATSTAQKSQIETLLTTQGTNIEYISTHIIAALENSCLKDLEQRKQSILKLHNSSFKMSKESYAGLVDSVFDELDQFKKKSAKLATEQQKLSEESLVYFDPLDQYVLDKVDAIIDQLKERGEVINIEKTEMPHGLNYGETGKACVLRDVTLKNNKRIRYRVLFNMAIHIIGNEQSPRLVITSQAVEPLTLGPQPSVLQMWSGQELKITYPLGEDPLMSEPFRKAIDGKLSEFLKLLFFQG